MAGLPASVAPIAHSEVGYRSACRLSVATRSDAWRNRTRSLDRRCFWPVAVEDDSGIETPMSASMRHGAGVVFAPIRSCRPAKPPARPQPAVSEGPLAGQQREARRMLRSVLPIAMTRTAANATSMEIYSTGMKKTETGGRSSRYRSAVTTASAMTETTIGHAAAIASSKPRLSCARQGAWNRGETRRLLI